MEETMDREYMQRMLATLDAALVEDIREGDITVHSLPLAGIPADGTLRAKADGVVAGLSILKHLNQLPVMRSLDMGDAFAALEVNDGDAVSAGQTLATVSGNAALLLQMERSILNLISRCSGIATLTKRFVEQVNGTFVRICDTRKTAPGLRYADKYGVLCGGGTNHRFGLFDQAMIKENHLALSRQSIGDAVRKLRERLGDTRLTCEAETIEQVREALEAEVDCVLLDNFSLEDVDAAVAMRKRMEATRVALEVSGGITLENVRAYAETGVDRISIGALTHSAPALDINLKIVPVV